MQEFTGIAKSAIPGFCDEAMSYDVAIQWRMITDLYNPYIHLVGNRR